MSKNLTPVVTPSHCALPGSPACAVPTGARAAASDAFCSFPEATQRIINFFVVPPTPDFSP